MKWEDFYDVMIDPETSGNDKMYADIRFLVVEKATGKTVGSYRDHVYAMKQAKYKFKKNLDKIEKVLLG